MANYDIKVLRHPFHKSATGGFIELARESEAVFKQVSLCMIQPGNDRGGHYHTRKEDWFCVVEGEMILKFEDGKGFEKEMLLSAEDPCMVHIPTGLKHSVINKTEKVCKFIILANEEFDPNDPDTFPGLPTENPEKYKGVKNATNY